MMFAFMRHFSQHQGVNVLKLFFFVTNICHKAEVFVPQKPLKLSLMDVSEERRLPQKGRSLPVGSPGLILKYISFPTDKHSSLFAGMTKKKSVCL